MLIQVSDTQSIETANILWAEVSEDKKEMRFFMKNTSYYISMSKDLPCDKILEEINRDITLVDIGTKKELSHITPRRVFVNAHADINSVSGSRVFFVDRTDNSPEVCFGSKPYAEIIGALSEARTRPRFFARRS